jgi:hypothetical protein
MIKRKLEGGGGAEEENLALDLFEASSFIFTVLFWFAHLTGPDAPSPIIHTTSSTFVLLH